MSNEKISFEIKEDTGEVIDDNSYNFGQVGRLKFRTGFYNPAPCVGQDLSNEIEDVYIEVAPYAVDPATGKFLNESSVPKIIPNGKVNVQERIQSFAKEVDLYSILEKFAYSDDVSLINARPCSYGDLSELPNDLNGFALYCKNNFDKLNDMNPEIAKMILDENISAEQITAKANEIYNERIAAFEAAKEGDNK